MLSDFIKKHRFVQKAYPAQHDLTSMVLADRRTKYEWASNAQSLKEEVKKLPHQDKLLLSNFISDSKMFQWAGIGFSQTVTEQIHQSIKRLVTPLIHLGS